MFDWRLMFGSGLRSGRTPKVALLVGPISLFCAMLSKLVARETAEQPVPAALMSQSNQLRLSFCAPGAYRLANPPVWGSQNLLQPNFNAVLPFPNTSYAALNRGARSPIQFGVFFVTGK